MPSTAIVQDFLFTVEAGRFVEALERFYAEDASMRENIEPPRIGLETLVEYERGVMTAFKSITGYHLGRVLIGGDQVAIRWRFEFVGTSGEARTLDEIAWQRWRGDRIVEEQFFYDPKQLGR